MDRFMYQDDSFEQLLKQKADEYRMYPADQSWNVIYNQLHHPNRFNWKAASFFTAALLTAGLWVSINQHEVNPANVSLTASATLQTESKLKPQKVSGRNAASSTGIKNADAITVADVQQKIVQITDKPVSEKKPEVTNETVSLNESSINSEPVKEEILLTKTDAQELKSTIIPAADFASIAEENLQLVSVNPVSQTAAIDQADENKTDADLNYEVHIPVLSQKPLPKAQLQFHLTPSASYRVLVSDNRFNFGNLSDPESAVRHHTSLGFEAGATFVKPLNRILSFTAGIQFNFTNYTMVGSRYNPELATVILNSARNVQRYTNLRTQNGYFPEDIANKTYQFSIPVGLQIRLLQTKKFSWNLGSTLQPTYQFNSTGYLVTNDYKNYIKAPEFLRTFNMNYSIESFLKFNATSRNQIILGPQFRYQLFSNSKGNYPVQEHLVDYGFRIGFIRTLK